MKKLLAFTAVLALSATGTAQNLKKDSADYRQNKTLKNLNVTASRQIFRQKDGALTVRIAGTTLSRYKRMEDIIAVIPGMVAKADGGLEVFAQGAPMVYINDRKVLNDNEWKNLDPETVKTIELITAPGSQYDAETNAVLKITTLKKKQDNLAVKLEHQSKQGDYYSHNETIFMALHQKKLDLSVSYNYYDGAMKVIQPAFTGLLLGTDYHTWQYDQRDKRPSSYSQWNLQSEYHFTERMSAGIKTEGYTVKSHMQRTGIMDYAINGIPAGVTNLHHNDKNNTGFYHVNAFYNTCWNKSFSTNVSLDYARNHSKERQQTIEETGHETLDNSLRGITNLDLYAARLNADWHRNQWLHLVFGGEYNGTVNNGQLTTSSNMPESNYKNKETRVAAFVKWQMQTGKLSMACGIRYEHSYAYFQDFKDSGNNFSRTYNRVYPSFSISWQGNEWGHSLAFVSTLRRPGFTQLSNNTYYSDRYVYQKGNPLLKPAASYTLQWTSSYRYLNFNLQYKYTRNLIGNGYEDTGSNTVVHTYVNYPKGQYVIAGINLQKTFGWWSPSLSVNLMKPFFTALYRGNARNYNTPYTVFTVNQLFTFPKDYLLTIYYNLQTGGYYAGTVSFRPLQNLTMEIQKNFLNKRLNVSLKAYDIFHTVKYKESQYLNAITFQQTEDYRLWYYAMTITFRLNKDKTKYSGKSAMQDDLDRM